jgi:hypothetical protein
MGKKVIIHCDVWNASKKLPNGRRVVSSIKNNLRYYIKRNKASVVNAENDEY